MRKLNTTKEAQPGIANGVKNLMPVTIKIPIKEMVINPNVEINILTASTSVYTAIALNPCMTSAKKFILDLP